MSLVLGRGLGVVRAEAEAWLPLLTLHFPCSLWSSDSPVTSQSWNGVGSRQPQGRGEQC